MASGISMQGFNCSGQLPADVFKASFLNICQYKYAEYLKIVKYKK